MLTDKYHTGTVLELNLSSGNDTGNCGAFRRPLNHRSSVSVHTLYLLRTKFSTGKLNPELSSSTGTVSADTHTTL